MFRAKPAKARVIRQIHIATIAVGITLILRAARVALGRFAFDAPYNCLRGVVRAQRLEVDLANRARNGICLDCSHAGADAEWQCETGSVFGIRMFVRRPCFAGRPE